MCTHVYNLPRKTLIRTESLIRQQPLDVAQMKGFLFTKRRKTLLEKEEMLVITILSTIKMLSRVYSCECQNANCVVKDIKSLPHDKILNLTKLKAFADDKIHLIHVMNSLFDGVENIMGKEKMLVTTIFSFSHNVFKSSFLHDRVQRFPEKALVLKDECLPKGTRPALIKFTHPFSNQFKLKES